MKFDLLILFISHKNIINNFFNNKLMHTIMYYN